MRITLPYLAESDGETTAHASLREAVMVAAWGDHHGEVHPAGQIEPRLVRLAKDAEIIADDVHLSNLIYAVSGRGEWEFVNRVVRVLTLGEKSLPMPFSEESLGGAFLAKTMASKGVVLFKSITEVCGAIRHAGGDAMTEFFDIEPSTDYTEAMLEALRRSAVGFMADQPMHRVGFLCSVTDGPLGSNVLNIAEVLSR